MMKETTGERNMFCTRCSCPLLFLRRRLLSSLTQRHLLVARRRTVAVSHSCVGEPRALQTWWDYVRRGNNGRVGGGEFRRRQEPSFKVSWRWEKSTLDLPPSREGTRNEFAALCFARDHKKTVWTVSASFMYFKQHKFTTRSDTCIVCMLQVNERLDTNTGLNGKQGGNVEAADNKTLWAEN